MSLPRIWFLIIFTSFVILYSYFNWKQYDVTKRSNLAQEFLKTGNQHFNQNQNETITNLKHILLWNSYNLAPLNYFEEGQKSFIKYNCSAKNCYVNTDRKLFNGDITKFDAVAFNGRTMKVNDLPGRRSPHQKYIYFNMESADNYPACDEEFDDFFNWTCTYKLDSDIPYTYIIIRNKEGAFIGPKINMQWPQNVIEVNSGFAPKLGNKTKAAAWFVSNCSSRSGRSLLVYHLQKALEPYNLTVDIYGKCGSLQCPRSQKHVCNSMLARDYFFYLSFENSFAEDYVTEKLLAALQHDTVPIVYGGADYSRFLPPGSYIDARKFNVKKLAATMNQLINDPKLYASYFTWKSQYIFSDPPAMEKVCAVCAAMNSDMFETVTIYDKFREWWNNDYEFRCKSSMKLFKKKQFNHSQ